jgi:hypothetical protein
MTPAARVAADIDAILLHALMDQVPIPGYGSMAWWPPSPSGIPPCPAT